MTRPPRLSKSICARDRRGLASAIARRRRRGLTVLVVVLLLSITLGLMYAVVRSQTTALQIQQNANLRASARLAALTGLTVGLKKMHTSEWCYGDGVNTTLAGYPGDHQQYTVTYAVGDKSLASDDPNYAVEYACRVTLRSIGTGLDPNDPQRKATHYAQAVVRLAPRSFPPEPTDWPAMQRYTVYQWKKDNFEVDIPCRLAGPVRVQGQLKVAPHYPDGSDAWSRYLGDLNAMRLAGYPDYRPFNGPVDLPYGNQSWTYLSALTGKLGVVAEDIPEKPAASDWTKPDSLASYQIYPGGPVYKIPMTTNTLENITLGPDPLTNPLGIYYHDTNMDLRGSVTIHGSLICRDDIDIDGTNVHFEPVELPGLQGYDGPVRLPAASCRKFIVKNTGGGSLTGLVAVFDEFRVDKSPATVSFLIAGRVITDKLYIKERQPWETANWGGCYQEFQDQLDGEEGPVVPYFPVWMAQRGYDPKPHVIIKPDSAPVTYHWKIWENQYDPIFVPHPDDDGLRWEVLEWTDNP